jgi:hypothetical protein
MIDNKTGKYYVYRLKHKPTGKYFHELTWATHSPTQSGVILKDVSDKVFTSPEQLGKLWSRVEENRNALFQLESMFQSNSAVESERTKETLDKFKSIVQTMDDMEIEICELIPAPENKLKKSLLKRAKESQVQQALKSRFGECCVSGNNVSVDLFNGYQDWLKMPNKEEWTHLASLNKNRSGSVIEVLNKVEELGIKTYTFDPERHPRTIAIKEEDLNFIRLTDKNIIRNSVEIAKITGLYKAICVEFGLSEI